MAYRIIILGPSCAGKTTLGRQLGQCLNIRHIDLDDLRFLPEWVERSDDDFFEQVHQAIKGRQNWVISGSYKNSWNITMPKATHVIFLDRPLVVLLARLFWRTCRRAITRERICGGNRENGHALFLLSYWIIKTHKRKRQKFQDLQAAPYHPDTKFIHIKRVGDVQSVIDGL